MLKITLSKQKPYILSISIQIVVGFKFEKALIVFAVAMASNRAMTSTNVFTGG